MMVFNIKAVRGIAQKETRKAQKSYKKEVKSIIRTLKADIKKSAKKGVTSFMTKIRWIEEYNEVKNYFIAKGFRCWNYTSDDFKYLAIAW